MNDRFYFRQWLAGRDFATTDQTARQMVNLVYAVGDRVTGEALLIDPAYDPVALLGLLAEDDMHCVGALITHYHPDHAGGEMMGLDIAGISTLLEEIDVPIHVQRAELPWMMRRTGVSEDVLVAHESADVVSVGEVEVTLIHTPGHTPGSQCFLVEQRLISGDTLFLEGCGRTDLPGSDPEEMYRSLRDRLSRVSDDTTLFPGHLYSAAPSAPMSEVREYNPALAPVSSEQWLSMFAR